jgi:hypothetical protein
MSQFPFVAYKQRPGAHIPLVLVGVILSCLAAGAIGLLYGALDWYIPFVKLRFLLTLGAGLLTGFCISYSLSYLGHLRPWYVRVALGSTFMMMAYLLCWVTWLHSVIGWSGIIILPSEYYDVIAAIYEKGAWGMSAGKPFAQLELAGIWGLEALLFLGGGIAALCHSPNDEKPYCESCKTWTLPDPNIGLFDPPATLHDLQSNLSSGALDTLFDLSPLSPESQTFISATVYECPQCKSFKTLSVMQKQMQFNENGRLADKVTQNLAHLVIDTNSSERMIGIFQAAQDAIKAAALAAAQPPDPTIAPAPASDATKPTDA